jgi:hypothetical protein
VQMGEYFKGVKCIFSYFLIIMKLYKNGKAQLTIKAMHALYE